jgi:hypothetical protein
MDGGRYALLIGTWQYQHEKLPDLKSPKQDIRDLAAVLADPTIGAFDRAELLENRTAHEIRVAVETFFADRHNGDLLVLYFSGHGLKDQHGHFYFAASDTDPRRLIATGISANFIHEVIQGSLSRSKVILMDSCYGGAVIKGLVVKSADQITPDELGGDAQGLVILTATDSLSYAFETPETGDAPRPSVFTKHLVHGLRTGEADLEHDGVVTVDELYEYVRRRVREEVPGQDPKKWEFEAAGGLIFAKTADPALVELPKQIQETIDNWFPTARVGAVELLIKLAKNPHMRLSAIAALEKLLQDDSDQVKRAAQNAISQLDIQSSGASETHHSADKRMTTLQEWIFAIERAFESAIVKTSSVKWIIASVFLAIFVAIVFGISAVQHAANDRLRESLTNRVGIGSVPAITSESSRPPVTTRDLTIPATPVLLTASVTTADKLASPNVPENPQALASEPDTLPSDRDEGFIRAYAAARDGDLAAQNNLGDMYYFGTNGLDRDYQQALKWYEKSAGQGFRNAQYNLARLFENGQGTRRNPDIALKWYKRAADQGDEDAAEAMKRLAGS